MVEAEEAALVGSVEAAVAVVVVMAAEVAVVVVVVMVAEAADTGANEQERWRCRSYPIGSAATPGNMQRIIPISLALLLVACSKLSVENYDKLKVGMPYAEVTQILGAPAQCSDVLGAKHCRWGDDQRYVEVNFIGDQALIFSAENIR